MAEVKMYATFRDLMTYLEEQEPDRGTWPEVEMWQYQKGRSADIQAWRIRHGKILLPDHKGGTNGRWAARVVRANRRDKDGPASLFVRYLGRMK